MNANPSGNGLSCTIVTGAGGDMGRAIALRFARENKYLVLLDRDESLLVDMAEEAKAAGAAGIQTYAADQTDRAAIDRVIERIAIEVGPIEFLIANAGFARMGSFLELTSKIWDLHVDINLNGTFHTCQSVSRKMVEQGAGGSIVLVSSCLGLYHSDQNAAYCATKASLLMLTRTIAAELGIYGIRANAVLPGVIETAMTRSVMERPGSRDAILQETPVGRLGKPSDVAEAIWFLSSPAASFITGASLLVDGGQSIYGQPQWVRQDRTTPKRPEWRMLGEV